MAKKLYIFSNEWDQKIALIESDLELDVVRDMVAESNKTKTVPADLLGVADGPEWIEGSAPTTTLEEYLEYDLKFRR